MAARSSDFLQQTHTLLIAVRLLGFPNERRLINHDGVDGFLTSEKLIGELNRSCPEQKVGLLNLLLQILVNIDIQKLRQTSKPQLKTRI
ncbi:hypothetical protein WA1_14110 [Scytonema hofmannii PCC 7110]|uniref:Uncharacterized protein n=1 Tax=Scytonema hofmannii PCC 7110 TaxID=128403 RepID=A0A139XEV0_9CYAN|nr:hypothetical protein [Scytonema hofmannii]KYC43225.1 hypothetical protein WA1_14110 [Scytonema hofmannii PCC 7110]